MPANLDARERITLDAVRALQGMGATGEEVWRLMLDAGVAVTLARCIERYGAPESMSAEPERRSNRLAVALCEAREREARAREEASRAETEAFPHA